MRFGLLPLLHVYFYGSDTLYEQNLGTGKSFWTQRIYLFLRSAFSTSNEPDRVRVLWNSSTSAAKKKLFCVMTSYVVRSSQAAYGIRDKAGVRCEFSL